jgi:predicted dehydrogenase
MSMPKRIAAIDVSHWHSAYDACYLSVLRGLGCDIVGVSDRSERIATDRANRFGGIPFTDYRRMIDATRPEFVIALGRHCDMPNTFRFLVDAGVPFLMEKPWGTDPDTVADLARLAGRQRRLGNGPVYEPLFVLGGDGKAHDRSRRVRQDLTHFLSHDPPDNATLCRMGLALDGR